MKSALQRIALLPVFMLAQIFAAGTDRTTLSPEVAEADGVFRSEYRGGVSSDEAANPYQAREGGYVSGEKNSAALRRAKTTRNLAEELAEEKKRMAAQSGRAASAQKSRVTRSAVLTGGRYKYPMRAIWRFEKEWRNLAGGAALVPTGKVLFGAGAVGEAAYFTQGNAVNALLMPAPDEELATAAAAPGEPFSISFFFRLSPEGIKRTQYLAGAFPRSGQGRTNWYFRYDPQLEGRIEVMISNHAGTRRLSLPAGNKISAAQWHHAVLVCDGKNAAASVAPLTQSHHVFPSELRSLSGLSPAHPAILLIGAGTFEVYTRSAFEGAVDEFLLAEGVFSPADVEAIFQGAKSGKPSDQMLLETMSSTGNTP
ncbi:MAG: hypothetical protein PHS41_07905 [Victivallaceae bacterium]|nr:hypothetical protein [Victivallaceae bacterium]